MRILIVTQYFYPEFFKSTDLAVELKKRGHDVEALVGIPNYPQGKYFKGYGIFRKRQETYEGVKIHRVFQFPRGKKSSIGMILNYFSYAFNASLWAIFFACLKRRFDKIIVFQTSPIMQAHPAVVYKKLRGTPIYLWVLDIWPDSMKNVRGFNSSKLLNIMTRYVQWVYNNSYKILISSKGFRDLILRHGKYENKIIYYPNWSDYIGLMPKKEIPPLPEGFKIMMAGNLGSAQTIKEVMKAAELLKDKKQIKWIFVGDGSEREYIEKFRDGYNMQETIYVMGRFPFDCMSAFYSQADAMLITLRAKYPHNKAVVPARLQSYMSSGKPILGMIDGGSADMIKEADCGLTVPAEDYQGLADLIIKEVLPNRDSFSKKGENGRKYFLKHFTKELCINNIEKILLD